MTNSLSNRRAGSEYSGSTVSTHRRQSEARPHNRSGEPLRLDPLIHTTNYTFIHNLPQVESSGNSCYHGNKVILSFEEEFSLSDAQDWVFCYNQKRGTKLTIVDALPLALFVVLLDVDDPLAAKTELLAAYPLGVREVYASVNRFSERPDP